ncbi:MAG: SDR family oxidoreductase [Acidimicrobiia bacterium]|nr:SDR family oxidoreductase [Acidimicrobiia bacterium]
MDSTTDGRTFLVTGANTGIGRVTARELARRGGRVVLACRSAEKTTPVIDDIRATTDNDDVSFLELDLADLTSVRRAGRTLLEDGEPLHVLVANAGLAGKRGVTTQGFELAFGTNHLGHFLFTTMLCDLLRSSAPARVVVVSSDSHYQAKGIPFDDLRRSTRSITGLREYAVSKLANVLFAQELARRIPASEVTTVALHPGVIASDVWRQVPRPVRAIMTRRMASVEQGAQTSLYCATAPDMEGHSGDYFADCQPKEPSAVATPALAAELWKRSEAWTAES